MQEILKRYPSEEFKTYYPSYGNEIKPVLRGVWQGGETYFVDSRNGTLANDLTPENFKEERVYPAVHSILYWLDKNNPNGERPKNPENDPQFNLWEDPIKKWLETNPVNIQTPPTKNTEPVTQKQTPTTAPALKPQIEIISPSQIIKYSQKNAIKIAVSPKNFTPSRVEYYLNGEFIGSSNVRPFDFSFSPSNYSGIAYYNNIRIVAYSFLGEKVEVSTSFIVSE
jgi:hypothetical protein